MSHHVNTNKRKPKVVASIEARMSSSRFPGKMLADLNGQPALTRLIRRLRQCRTLDDIILATSVEAADDALEDWAKKEGVKCYRGSEDDVLLRVVETQQTAGGEVVVEITGDCILTDPDVVDIGVNTFLANNCDMVTNCERFSFPPGLYVQVFRLADLEEVEEKIDDPAVREHVSLYFYEHPERYRIIHLMASPRWLLPQDCRLYLDYPEDLQFLKEIYRRLESRYGEAFGAQEIVNLLHKEPELMEINRYCENKPVR
ncbi:MAG: glycosyltransferase family protein [bacterium]